MGGGRGRRGPPNLGPVGPTFFFCPRSTYDSSDDGVVSDDVVQLRRLRLTLRRQGEVLEVEVGALRVGADQVGRLVRVEERERLRARPVSVDAHGVGRTSPRSSLDAAAARPKRHADWSKRARRISVCK